MDNTESLIDKTDMVFIDAMGTGYSHLVGKGTPQMFYGIDEDMAAFGQFINTYVNRNDRWNSPKFLMGESYGTFRSAVLGNYLQSRYTMHLNGIVLMSSVLDLSSLTFGPGDDRVYVYYLPSYAAVAWYHKALKNRPANLEAFIEEARQYGKNEYATALFKGDKISAADKDAVAKKLSYFTGLSEDFLKKANLRVTLGQFNVELLRSRGLTVGRIDARFTGYTRDLLSENSAGDPEGPAVGGAFTAMLNQYNHDELKFGLDKDYHNQGGGNWNWVRAAGGRGGGGGGFPGAPNVSGDLANAMMTNPKLLVEVENGYFDMATPFFATEFTMEHLGLPSELQGHVQLKYYDAGHMMYLRDSARTQLHANIAAFVDKATKQYVLAAINNLFQVRRLFVLPKGGMNNRRIFLIQGITIALFENLGNSCSAFHAISCCSLKAMRGERLTNVLVFPDSTAPRTSSTGVPFHFSRRRLHGRAPCKSSVNGARNQIRAFVRWMMIVPEI